VRWLCIELPPTKRPPGFQEFDAKIAALGVDHPSEAQQLEIFNHLKSVSLLWFSHTRMFARCLLLFVGGCCRNSRSWPTLLRP
jgi:hypothetical protein